MKALNSAFASFIELIRHVASKAIKFYLSFIFFLKSFNTWLLIHAWLPLINI